MGTRLPFGADESVLKLYRGGGCITLRMFSMPLDCTLYFFFFLIYFIEVWLTYSVSGAQRGDSVIHVHILFLRLFSIIGYYKILTIVPCAIQ